MRACKTVFTASNITKQVSRLFLTNIIISRIEVGKEKFPLSNKRESL